MEQHNNAARGLANSRKIACEGAAGLIEAAAWL
jgi:hypothetical protein